MKKSEFTDAVQNLVKEADGLRGGKRQPPPMQEEVTSREARSRVSNLTKADLLGMTPENRRALLDAVGSQGVLDVIRRA